jgi:hypothetical protein
LQNPLESYRRTQRQLRLRFDEFTRTHCPGCPTPCCLKPARIAPADILLAEATGWRPSARVSGLIAAASDEPASGEPGAVAGDPVAPDVASLVAGRIADALASPPESAEDACGEPCEFLAQDGCTFPADLRPFGCTTYICRYMHASMDRRTLAVIKRLVRELEQKRQMLRTSL